MPYVYILCRMNLAIVLYVSVYYIGKRDGLVVRASGSGARVKGFDPYMDRHIVSLTKTFFYFYKNILFTTFIAKINCIVSILSLEVHAFIYF